MFLNCTVRTVDGTPIVGVPIHSFYLAEPAIMYCGYSDSVGEVRSWSYPDSSDHQKYSIVCPQGSTWRIFFEIPDHPFPGISADLHVPLTGTSDSNANVTLTIAPGTIAISNGSFEDICRQNGVNLESPSSGPYFVGRRNSSSLGSISDISSFTLDSEEYGGDIILLRDVASIVSPPQSPVQSPVQPPVELSDAEVVGGWLDTQTGMEEEDSCSSHKRKHDGDESGNESKSAKRARSSRNSSL